MAQTYGPRIITDDLVCSFDGRLNKCYPGSGTTLFNMGSSNANFTLNGATVDSNGDLVLAGQGTADGVTHGDNIAVDWSLTNLQNYTGGVTYEIWINPGIAGRRALFYGSDTINHLEIYGDEATVRTEARYENGYSFGATGLGGGFPVGEWTLLTIVFAPHDTIRPVYWYINGVLEYTKTNFHSGTTGTGEGFYFSNIGRSTGNTSYLYAKSFLGKLNCFRVYGKSFNANEVMLNYNAVKRRFGK